MKKMIKTLVGFTLCMGMLTGCAKTPETSLVKQKGSNALAAYKEADDTKSTDMIEKDSTQNTDDSEENTKKGASTAVTIRDLLNAPQTYKSQVTDDSAKLVVNTDATVEVPEVEKISAISVTPAEVTQELLDHITDAFFQDAKLYTSDSYYIQTKNEIKQTLDELKEDVAEGNLDPYGYGTDENGNYTYDIYSDIEYWEEEYDKAPETKTLVEARPTAGSQKTDSDGNVIGDGNNEFSGVAQMTDGSEYYYQTTSSGSDTFAAKIRRTVNVGGGKLPADAAWFEWASSEDGEQPTEDSIGISLDEAKQMVQEKVEELGITDLQFADWNYAVCKNLENDDSMNVLENGYLISYTRTVNGVPITVTIDDGGALEDMDSTMETWSYERLYFYVDKDGIASMYYSNPYMIGETKTDKLSLLPFSEIMKTYEKMMIVTNADNMEYEKSRVYDIDRIVLGYARIYEPSNDAHTGLLVPVWDFFGTRKTESEYDGQNYSDTTDNPTWSFLTINAVDGSIIDRSLGY
ncbi:MAG: DUF6034 family protein [Clostridia bacterium]|nr:DUF6034 family protein [Clostridia bacterium]